METNQRATKLPIDQKENLTGNQKLQRQIKIKNTFENMQDAAKAVLKKEVHKYIGLPQKNKKLSK